MKKKFLLAITIVSVLIFLFMHYVWGTDWNSDEQLKGLIDSLFATGVLLIGFAWMILISNFGLFDIAIYGTKKFFLVMVNRHQNMPKSYLEYSTSRVKTDKYIYLYTGAVGSIYLLASIYLLMFVYY